MNKLLMLALLPLLLLGCTTPGKDTFLQTDDPAWQKILDEKVDVDVDQADLATLFCQTPAFADINITVRPKRGVSAASDDAAAFDDPTEKIRVTLHKEGLPRREVLRLLAHDGHLRIGFAMRGGKPVAIVVMAK